MPGVAGAQARSDAKLTDVPQNHWRYGSAVVEPESWGAEVGGLSRLLLLARNSGHLIAVELRVAGRKQVWRAGAPVGLEDVPFPREGAQHLGWTGLPVAHSMRVP